MKRFEAFVRKYELAMLATMGFAIVTAALATGVARVVWFAVAIVLAAVGSVGWGSMWARRRRGGDNGAQDQEAQPGTGQAGQGPGGRPGTR